MLHHVIKTTKKGSESLSEIMHKTLLPRSVFITNEVHAALGKVSSKTVCVAHTKVAMLTPF